MVERVRWTLLGQNVLKFCFWEAAFVGTGRTCLIDASAQLPHIPHLLLAHKTQLLTFNKKSCIVSAALWTWLDLYSQYATSSLIIVGYWFLSESDDLSAAGGTVSEWCIARRHDCQVICPFYDFTVKVASGVVRLSLCCWYYQEGWPAGWSKGRL